MARAYVWVGGLAASATVAATAVYATMTFGHDEPPLAGTTLEAYLDDYLAHRASLLDLDRLANILLVIGLLGLGVLVLVRPATGPRGAAAFGTGAVIAALAQVTYLAAEERILAVRATPGFNAATLATMLDVADRVDDYAENLGLMLMAVGVTRYWPAPDNPGSGPPMSCLSSQSSQSS